MIRWLQSRRERELEAALRYAEAANEALERKEHLYHEALKNTPLEKPG